MQQDLAAIKSKQNKYVLENFWSILRMGTLSSLFNINISYIIMLAVQDKKFTSTNDTAAPKGLICRLILVMK